MPTFAKLVSGIAFALVAMFASSVFIPLLPEGTQVGMLIPLNSFIGFLCGWLVLGRMVGKGYYSAAGTGVRTSCTLLFFALLLWSCYEMIVLSTRLRYDGPMQALTDMMAMIVEYGLLMGTDMQGPIILLVGGILSGFLAEWSAERFA
ncbi:TrgA family protein [Actibacterium sp. 188UL27-1]|uniref:TrgA family protein n=1 Tax=Actibacterium sp. 188UL27-1 TaxID=2786961 RepID=UPI00195B5FE9|nr:TrgA family protein [Actibacterium sp. 188UL27-1]MBM7067947.1 TrgA family protein [Actibacterium sp. 188UL27-1]